ncbi:MAG: hypothetical protein ACI80V_001683 [Rhodothermales bacterium]
MPSPWVTARDTMDGEDRPFRGAIFLQRLDGVTGACRRKIAGRREVGRNHQLVTTYQKDQKLSRYSQDDTKHATL